MSGQGSPPPPEPWPRPRDGTGRPRRVPQTRSQSQTYGAGAVDDGRDGGQGLRVAFQALVCPLGRESRVRPDPRAAPGTRTEGVPTRDRPGGSEPRKGNSEGLGGPCLNRPRGKERTVGETDQETEARPRPPKGPLLASGRRPAYEVSRDGRGDERVRAVDQGPADDQHY